MSSLNENGPSSEDDDEELAILRAAALKSKRSATVPSNHNSPSHVPIASDPPSTYQPVESLVNVRDGLEQPKNDIAYVPHDIYVPTDTYIAPPAPAEMYTLPPPSIDMYARPPHMESYGRPPPEMFLQRMPADMYLPRPRFFGPPFHRGRMPFGRPNFMRPPPRLMQAPPPAAVPSAAANSNLIVIQTADGDSAPGTAASFQGSFQPLSRGGFSGPFQAIRGAFRGRGRGQGPRNSQPQQTDAASLTPMFVRPQDKWTGADATVSSAPKTKVSTKFSRYDDDSSDSDDHESTDTDSDSDGSGSDGVRVPSTPTDSHVDLHSSPMQPDESVELNDDAVDPEVLVGTDLDGEFRQSSLPLPTDCSRPQTPSVDDQKIAVVGGSSSPVCRPSPARSSSSLSSGSDLGPHSPIRSPLRLDSPAKPVVRDRRSPVRSRSPSDHQRLSANRSPSPAALKSPGRLPVRDVENPIIRRSGSGLEEVVRRDSRSASNSHRSHSPSPLRPTAITTMVGKAYLSSPPRHTSPLRTSKRNGSSRERSFSPPKPSSPPSPNAKRLRHPAIQRSVDASRSRERSLERLQFLESRSPSPFRRKSPARGSSPSQHRDFSRSPPSAERLNVDRLESQSLQRISPRRKSPVYSGPAGRITRSRSRSRSVEARPLIIRRSPGPRSPYRRVRSRSPEQVLLDDRQRGRQWSRSPRHSRSRSVDRKPRSPDQVHWRRSPSDSPRDRSPRRYAETHSQLLSAAGSKSRVTEISPERLAGRRSPALSRYPERRQDFTRSPSRSPKVPDILRRSRSPVTRPSNGRSAFKDSLGRSYGTKSPLRTSPKRRSLSPAPYRSPLRLRSKSVDRTRRSPVRKSPIRRCSPNAAQRSPLRARGVRRSRSGERSQRSPSLEKRAGFVERRRSASKERTRPRSTDRDKATVRRERRSGSLERTYRAKSRSPVSRKRSRSRSLERTTNANRTQIQRQSSDSQFAVSSRQRSPNRALPSRDRKRISPPDSRKSNVPGKQRSPVNQPAARSRQAGSASDLRSRLRHSSPTQSGAKDSEALRRGVGCPVERKEGSNSGGEHQKKHAESDERRRDRDVLGVSRAERDTSRRRTSRDRKTTTARLASHQQVDASSSTSGCSDLPSRSEILEARKRKFERPPQIETGGVKTLQRESRRSPDSDSEIKNKISKTSDSLSKNTSVSDKNSARSKSNDVSNAESLRKDTRAGDNLQEEFSDISSATSEFNVDSDLENMHSDISENESDDDDPVGLREKRFTERADIIPPPLKVENCSKLSSSRPSNQNRPPRRTENRPPAPPRNRRRSTERTARHSENLKPKFRPRSPTSGFSEVSPPNSPHDGGKMISSVVKVADGVRERDSGEGNDTRTAIANAAKSNDQIAVSAVSKLLPTADDTQSSSLEKHSSPVRVVVKKASGTDESVKSRPSVHSRLGARHNTDSVASDLSSTGTSSLPAKVSGEVSTVAMSGRRAKDAAPKLVDLRDRLRGAVDTMDVALDEPLDDGLEQAEQSVGGAPWRRRRRSKNNSSSAGNRTFGRSRYS